MLGSRGRGKKRAMEIMKRDIFHSLSALIPAFTALNNFVTLYSSIQMCIMQYTSKVCLMTMFVTVPHWTRFHSVPVSFWCLKLPLESWKNGVCIVWKMLIHNPSATNSLSFLNFQMFSKAQKTYSILVILNNIRSHYGYFTVKILVIKYDS